MSVLKLSFFLLPILQLTLSNLLETPPLFRRQCPGDALKVLEGSTCDKDDAKALACSDNCFDIVY